MLLSYTVFRSGHGRQTESKKKKSENDFRHKLIPFRKFELIMSKIGKKESNPEEATDLSV
jgi:hypothetical protein